MVNANFLVALEDLLAEAKTKKETAGRSEEGRYWAVVVTELEKVYAFYKTYLFEGGSE